MSRRKDFGQSRSSGAVGSRLADRYSEAAPVEEASGPPAAPTPRPAMVTRSWYLPAETADRLTETADRIWRAVPGIAKRDALAALIEAGLERSDQVQEHLSQSSQD